MVARRCHPQGRNSGPEAPALSRSHHHHAEAKPLASSIHLQWGQQSAAGQRAHGLLPRPPQKGHSAGQPSACDTSGCQLLAVWVAAALSLAAGLEEGGTQADAPTRAAPAWVWVTVSMAPTPALSPDLAGPGIGGGQKHGELVQRFMTRSPAALPPPTADLFLSSQGSTVPSKWRCWP